MLAIPVSVNISTPTRQGTLLTAQQLLCVPVARVGAKGCEALHSRLIIAA
jgi:hypothetical protein